MQARAGLWDKKKHITPTLLAAPDPASPRTEHRTRKLAGLQGGKIGPVWSFLPWSVILLLNSFKAGSLCSCLWSGQARLRYLTPPFTSAHISSSCPTRLCMKPADSTLASIGQGLARSSYPPAHPESQPQTSLQCCHPKQHKGKSENGQGLPTRDVSSTSGWDSPLGTSSNTLASTSQLAPWDRGSLW